MRVEFRTFNLTEHGVSIYHSKYRMNLIFIANCSRSSKELTIFASLILFIKDVSRWTAVNVNDKNT